MRRLATGFGTARFLVYADYPELLEESAPTRSSEFNTPFGIIYLVPGNPTTAGGSYLSVGLWSPSWKGTEIAGIPEGTYRVDFAASFLRPEGVAPSVLEIRDGTVQEVVLNTGSWGGLTAVVKKATDSGAEIYGGPLNVEIQGPEPSRTSGAYTFWRPPYKVLGLSPGQYRVRGWWDDLSSAEVEYVIEAGAVKEGDVVLGAQ